jgi:hypothetical protein
VQECFLKSATPPCPGPQYPIALSAGGQLVSFLGAWAVLDWLRLAPQTTVVSRQFFLTRIVPIGVAQGIGIVLSNKLYMYLTVRWRAGVERT